MKKKWILIASLAAVMTLILVFVLSSEITGVPKKQVLADLEEEVYGTPINVSLKHNVDLALHTDTVTVKYDVRGPYATFHYTEEYQYFHDKSLDIWELEDIDSVSGELELHESLDEKVFKGKAGSRRHLNPPDIYYEIKVNNVNYDQNSVEIMYSIKTSEETYNGWAILDFYSSYQVTYFLEIHFDENGLRVIYD